MNWPLIILLLLVCFWLMGQGLTRRGGIYEVPFLAGAVFLGFVLPQLPALANDPIQPVIPLARMLAFSSVCALMVGVGWRAGQYPLKRGVHLTVDEDRLLYLALFLSLAGSFFYYKVSSLPQEIQLNYQASGIMVAYLFFARMLTYGFAISILCIARRPSFLAISIAAFDLILLGDRVIRAGRKGDTVEALLFILIAFWFYRGWTAPRLAALIGILVATVSLNSTGEYRDIVRDRGGTLEWNEISKINLVDNFVQVLKHGGPETRNAVDRMDFIAKTQSFDYGIFHWNALVWAFVPAQLLGTQFKQSLLVENDVVLSYSPSAGSTETGMSDAFASFWYLGAFKFFFIAYLLGRLYATARQGWVLPQILYMLGITSAMLTVSHHTQWLVTTYVQMIILLLPGLLLIRRRSAPSSSASPRAIPLRA